MLSDDRIAEMMRDTWGCASIAPRHAEAFARSIEAEVRKDDEALIRQLVEAIKLDRIDWEDWPDDSRTAFEKIRARLNEIAP